MIEGRITNLRALDAGDGATVARWNNDPAVRAHLGRRYPRPALFQEAAHQPYVASPQGYGAVHWIIETKDSIAIGDIGLYGGAPEDRHASIGMMIGETAYWSQGYGSDALRSVLRFAFSEMNLHRVELEAHADNARGIAAYRKCGFVEEGVLRDASHRAGAWKDHVVMAVLSEEFLARDAVAHREES